MQQQRATPADMDPDIDNHDVLYGVVLPNLRAQHESMHSRRAEYTDDEARRIDMTGLVLEMNHNDDWLPVGTTIAYRVQDGPSGGPASAEAVFKLNREPDTPTDGDELARITATQRNLLMSGYHRGFSLGHTAQKFNASCDEHGRVRDASTAPAITYVKFHKEVSTCHEGRRPGSVIKGYYPCARSLRRSTDDAIRSFAQLYGYNAPPHDAVPGMAQWDAYLARLLDAIRVRRRRELAASNFTPLLHARGFVAASNDAGGVLQRELLPTVCPDDFYLSTQLRAAVSAAQSVTKRGGFRQLIAHVRARRQQ